MLTEFTHISFLLEKTGLTLSNQITMQRKWVVRSVSVPKFLEDSRNFTVWLPRQTWYVSGILKAAHDIFKEQPGALLHGQLSSWLRWQRDVQKDCKIKKMHQCTSSLPIPVLGSVCFTVAQKLWVFRISFSLTNDMTRRCLHTDILNFSWLSFPVLLCYTTCIIPAHPSDLVCTALWLLQVFITAGLLLLVRISALCLLITAAFNAASVNRT